MEDPVRREDANWEYRSQVMQAYQRMIYARTQLEVALRVPHRRLNTAVKRDFYFAFKFFYGLVFPNLKLNEHKELINAIDVWDDNVSVGVVTDGLENGIALSVRLQRAVASDGILGK